MCSSDLIFQRHGDDAKEISGSLGDSMTSYNYQIDQVLVCFFKGLSVGSVQVWNFNGTQISGLVLTNNEKSLGTPHP